MREIRTSGSVGGWGGEPPWSTRRFLSKKLGEDREGMKKGPPRVEVLGEACYAVFKQWGCGDWPPRSPCGRCERRE